MANRNYNKIIEIWCQSVLLPRSFRYRFCRSCRQIPDYCNNAVRWRCRLCPQIMCASDTARGKYYCRPCGKIEGQRRSRLKASKP